MTRYWWMIGLVALFLGVGCSTGPESSAQNAFESWAKINGVPYQNVKNRFGSKRWHICDNTYSC